MMPIAPNPKGPTEGRRVIIAEHQEGVRPLPAWRFDGPGITLTRWHPTDLERECIAKGGDVWLTIQHEGALQPLAMSAIPSDLVDGWPDD